MRSCFIVIALLVTITAHAQDFRVENSIYIETQKDPVVRTLTLFNGDLVYDFAFAPGEGETIEQATLYDFTRNRLLVIDYTNNVKVEVSHENLIRGLADLSATVAESKSPLLKEMANPAFDVTAEEGLLTFTGKNLKYEVRTISAQTKKAAHAYQRFADWSARLTTALQNGSPPMARIKVNERLANDTLWPKEVTLTRSEGAIWENAKKLRSTHLINLAHTKTDTRRIEALNKKMAEIKSVNWSDFRTAAAAKTDGKKR